VDTEPALQAFWLHQVNLWCDRQYQMVDPVTPKAEREALMEKLQKLAARDLIRSDSLARVSG
jgi:hypothetical protein